jgi:hypothetical protein
MGTATVAPKLVLTEVHHSSVWTPTKVEKNLEQGEAAFLSPIKICENSNFSSEHL